MRSATTSIKIPNALIECLKLRVKELDYPNISNYVQTMICADLAGNEFSNHDFHDLCSRPLWYQDRVHDSIVSDFMEARRKKPRTVRRFKLPASLERERPDPALTQPREMEKRLAA